MSKQTRLFIAKNKMEKGLPITNEERELLLAEGGKKVKEAAEDYHNPDEPPVYTIGLYRNGKRFVTTRIKRSKTPKFFRLMFVENQYKEKGDNRPDYIGYFVEGGNYTDALNIKRPYATLKAKEDADK